MKNLSYKKIDTITEDFDVFLFDLWGVIIEGAKLYDGVVDSINKLITANKKCLFVSNAPRPAQVTYELIKSWGIELDKNNVFTSGEIAKKFIINNYKKVYHLGSDRNNEILKEISHIETIDYKQAEAILLTIYRDEGEDLDEFKAFFKKAAALSLPVICANPDTLIVNQGKARYCSGYFAEQFAKLGGKVLYMGKPHIEIYNEVLNYLPEAKKDRILMIGDTFENDILGASNAGIKSALVLTGNAEKYHREVKSLPQKLELLSKAAAKKNIIPDFIIGL